MKPTIDARSISDELASAIVMRARDRANASASPVSIAIVDISGVLKQFARLDPAPLVSVQVATDKAYTAVMKGMATHDWYEEIRNDPALLHGAPAAIDRLTIFGGGFPILVDSRVVGGIGVSGATSSEDMEIAQAGLEVVSELSPAIGNGPAFTDSQHSVNLGTPTSEAT